MMNDDVCNLTIRQRLDAILRTEHSLSPAVRAYLHGVQRIADAHACPLLDEEVVFINALHKRMT
ncbi:hypothetical protein [Paraburkholderia sp. J10-1]|uniref:hypothetical protein n=1 Tax=Paraburkholderia sp. J10-1 TaxID=2805430 RepID=UPI002AB717B0|nr:hypothetical protein [Paraburkholderia sp. J10-1]